MPFGHPKTTGSVEQEEQPLNTIVIESEQATDVLWEAIRSKLCKGMWTLLAKFPLSDSDNELFCDQRKINLLWNLCFLYPADEIWIGYKNYRKKLLEQHARNETLLQNINTDLIPSGSEVPSDVASFVKLCRAAEIMILEDAVILKEDIFPEKVPSFDFIHGSYLGRITLELQSVFESCVINKKSQEQRFLTDTDRPSSTRRGSLASISKQTDERQSGSRRGSCASVAKLSDAKENILSYKYCFTAMVALEGLIQKVTSLTSGSEGAGKQVARQDPL